MSDLSALARRRERQTGHEAGTWLSAIESARTSISDKALSPENLALLSEACRSPSELTVLARLIYQHEKTRPAQESIVKLLIESVNASPFSLADWASTLNDFHAWLSERDRKIELLPMVKYLECCVAAPEAQKSGQTLRTLAADMLSSFDYEAG